jgi:cell volume regulation protein A
MVEEIFTALGIIILIGFFGRAAYHRTKIPESVLMVLIGLLIGPVLGLVRADLLLPLLPFISVLALVLVLLDAGLELNVFKVMKGIGVSLSFTMLVAVFVTALIGLVLHLFLGWELPHAILIGLISSGTTTVAVMALIELIKTEPKTRNLLFLESVVNDFVLIFATNMLLIFISGSGTLDGYSIALFSRLSVSVLLGLAGGLLWINALKRTGMERFNYISSVGAIFLIYGLTQAVGGDGIIAALVFSFALGNYTQLYKWFRPEKNGAVLGEEIQIIKDIRAVHGDISFVVRIFFFVLIGAVLRFENLTPDVLLTTAIIILLILIGRYLSLFAVGRLGGERWKDSFVIVTMIPRGFVATVLAFIPLSMNIAIPKLTEIVLLLVLSTNIFAMVATSYYAGREKPGEGGKKKRRHGGPAPQ